MVKHEDYTKLIEDDSAYETEEQWLSECQEIFMRLEVDAKCLLKVWRGPGSILVICLGSVPKARETAKAIEKHHNHYYLSAIEQEQSQVKPNFHLASHLFDPLSLDL